MAEYRQSEWIEPPAGASPWGPAFALLRREVWRRRHWILAAALFGAAFGAYAKFLLPASYVATAQILFKPEGVKVFSNDMTPTRIDANAQIDFVESQMGVLSSERVLSRALRQECGRADPVAGAIPPPAFLRLCGANGLGESTKSVDALRKMMAIKRAERSFLVDLAVTAGAPDFAAQLANTVVTAYVDEDAEDRSATARRVTSELSGRLDALRASLAEAERKAQVYRNEKKLVQIGDKLIVEQKLADATAVLNMAQSQVERARARLTQFEATPMDSTALGSLGDETDIRTLVLLLDRRSLAQADLAPLAARLGANHPTLVQARSRLAEADRAVKAEVKAIRAAVRGSLTRAISEHDNFAKEVATLTRELEKARQDQLALQALDQTAHTTRQLVENFETRAREAEEFGKIDPNALRVASLARAPEPHWLLLGMALWSAMGVLLGAILALCWVALRTMMRFNDLVADYEVESLREIGEDMLDYELELTESAPPTAPPPFPAEAGYS